MNDEQLKKLRTWSEGAVDATDGNMRAALLAVVVLELIDELAATRQKLAEAEARMGEMRKALDHVAVSLNEWFAERRSEHEGRARELRERQERSLAHDDPPWIYAEETIRRDDAVRLEPIRALMRMADAALAASAPAAPVADGITDNTAALKAMMAPGDAAEKDGVSCE